MKLDRFEDVIISMAKNKGKRDFHLLIGNGFSMAYDSGIFSYNALHDFIQKIEDADLTKILGVIETYNFEEIMRNLDRFLAIVDAFEKGSNLGNRIRQANLKLRNGLLEAVKSLHPEHVFTIPEHRHQKCYEFLSKFLDTGGKVFSTNYDLLLYWVLMRNGEQNHCDGFGRELENPEEVQAGEDAQLSDLHWGKNKEEQNVYYLHGALPFFDAGIDIEKEQYNTEHFLLENIKDRMENEKYPVFVTAGDGKQKLSQIMHNRYLSFCYDALCELTGTLVTFGFNFGEYDEHIIDAVNKAANHGLKSSSKLWSIYIGVYSEGDRAHIAKIEDKFKCKVKIFDAKSVNIWGK